MGDGTEEREGEEGGDQKKKRDRAEWNGSWISNFETRATPEFLRENWRTAYPIRFEEPNHDHLSTSYKRIQSGVRVNEWAKSGETIQSNPIYCIISL